MKKLILSLLGLLLAGSVYAETITIQVTAEEKKAVESIVVDAQDWLQKAWDGKANSCIDRVILQETDKNPSKISQEDKKSLIGNMVLKSRIDKDKEK
jgi:hypothetical protein